MKKETETYFSFWRDHFLFLYWPAAPCAFFFSLSSSSISDLPPKKGFTGFTDPNPVWMEEKKYINKSSKQKEAAAFRNIHKKVWRYLSRFWKTKSIKNNVYQVFEFPEKSLAQFGEKKSAVLWVSDQYLQSWANFCNSLAACPLCPTTNTTSTTAAMLLPPPVRSFVTTRDKKNPPPHLSWVSPLYFASLSL